MQPCFILGVPRSGTTLLRVLLGNHSQILGFPETPWIVGGYGPASLRRLCEDLVSDRTGPVATVSGISAEDVYTATREFLERLTQPALTEAGKRLPLFKTPNDAVNVDFLFRLYPNASYIHIVRDGRDVACSTAGAKRAAQLAPRLAEFGENNVVNAARRWAAWETAIRDQMAAAGGLRSIRLCYEDLVREPKPAISAVCDFLDIPYQETMIDPGATTADLPAWEAGSTDVRERPRIDSASVGRWVSTFTRREAAQIDRLVGNRLVEYGYSRCSDDAPPDDLRRDPIVSRLPLRRAKKILGIPWRAFLAALLVVRRTLKEPD